MSDAAPPQDPVFQGPDWISFDPLVAALLGQLDRIQQQTRYADAAAYQDLADRLGASITMIGRAEDRVLALLEALRGDGRLAALRGEAEALQEAFRTMLSAAAVPAGATDGQLKARLDQLARGCGRAKVAATTLEARRRELDAPAG